MTRKVDYEYYEWLISQIHIPTRHRTYNDLFEKMHNLEFVWIVPNDDNRVQDGKDLRYEFLQGAKDTLALEGVTFLEVLVALSRRTAFTAGGRSDHWAWKLIKNLRLTKMSDPLMDGKIDRVDDILQGVIWRTYNPDGSGGFFPLKNPAQDQTKVEIWYQLNKYVMEMHAA